MLLSCYCKILKNQIRLREGFQQQQKTANYPLLMNRWGFSKVDKRQGAGGGYLLQVDKNP